MKRFITLLMLIAAFTVTTVFTTQAQVQVNRTLKSVLNLSSDTVTNAADEYLYTGEITSSNTALGIQLVMDRLSGTAAGTATLEASNDNSNWYPYCIGGVANDSCYSFTLTNVASQNTRWHVINAADRYFRVKVDGSGTQSLKISGRVMGKR